MAQIVGTTGPSPAAPKPPAPPRVSALTPQPAYVKPATTAQRTAATSTYRQAFGAPSGGYKGAVVHVFKAQPKPVQAQILKGALASARSVESKAILNYLKMSSTVKPLLASLKPLEGASSSQRLTALSGLADHLGYSDFALKLQGQYPQLKGLGSGYDLAFRLMQADAKPPDAAVIGSALGGEKPLASLTTQALTKQPAFVAPASVGARGKAADTFNRVRTAAQGGQIETPPAKAPGGGGLFATIEGDVGLNPATVAASLGQAGHIAGVTGKFLSSPAVNAAKDAYQMAVSIPTTVGMAVTNPVGLAKATGQQLVNMVQHPLRSLANHPLTTALVASAPFAGITRLAASPLRALAPADSLIGRALSTDRAPVALTGNLLHARPPFSKSPFIKAGQVLFDKLNYERQPTGELVPRSPWLRQHLSNTEVGHVVGPRERIRRANLDIVRHEGQAATRPSAVVRAGHAAKTALAYDPKAAVMRGAKVLPLIADGTIRTAGTFAKDLQHHVDEIAKQRPALIDDKGALAQHDATVASLTKVLADKKLLANPKPLFKAAEAMYARHVPGLEETLQSFGHYGPTMTKDGLLKRALSHYAVRHMGAQMTHDPVLSRDRLTLHGNPLSTAAVLEHLKGPEGTGGRIPVYTSDVVRLNEEKAARGSGYVSQERLPKPKTKRTTLYAYTHGLTQLGPDALIHERMRMQQASDAYRSQNQYITHLVTKPPGGYQSGYTAMQRMISENGWDKHGYVPFNIAPGHPAGSVEAALHDAQPAEFEHAMLQQQFAPFAENSPHLQPAENGRWGMVDSHVLQALRAHQGQISLDIGRRTLRGLNTQFRQVALSTSPKHVPGVAQESLIRAVGNGVGFRSWAAGRSIKQARVGIDPVLGREANIGHTGGMVAGMTMAHSVYTVSDHWAGTAVHPFLKAMEATFKAPGARQLHTAWGAWSHLVIAGTKRALEEQFQTAALGKMALGQHGYAEAARVDGMMGLIQRAIGLHGKLLDDAAKGMFDPAKLAQERAYIRQIAGRWTDLTPHGQTALMFSPFGLWWVNSAKFLMRMPRDMPVKTGALAAATLGSQQWRQQQGLDPLAPGALPGYLQGGYPLAGGKILAQNYYSPFGIAQDPYQTAVSLIEPWATPIAQGAGGVNWLNQPLSAPGQKKGTTPSGAEKAQYIINSILSSFVPLYTKAEQVAQGGASAYDVSGNSVLPPPPWQGEPTKKPGSLKAGLRKAVLPIREYKRPAASGSSTGGWGGSSSSSPSSSPSGGWGGSSSSTSSGWG